MNTISVLEKVRTEGPISRASLSRVTGLSRSTCSIIVDQLISEGLICETGKDESSGGRKAILLTIDNDGGRAIGIKLMQNRIAGALVDLKGQIIGTISKEMDSSFTEDELINDLHSVIDSLRQIEKKSRKKIFGIGIGIGGKIDFQKGVLIESSILNLRNIPIGNLIQDKTGIPVFLENDVNAFTLGEKYFGEGQDYSNFLCISLGSGIGAGVIIDESLYRGSHHMACEFGHMSLGVDSLRECRCGKKGCLEAYASDSAIELYYKESTGRNPGITEIVSLAEKEDHHALNAFSRAGRYLGFGISTLVNLFDPETIMIGGEGIVYYRYMEDQVRKSLLENTVYGLSDEINIRPVSYEDNLWVRGVATLVVKGVLRREI
ncbi:MAG: ROK family transcriptional regulator [Spirochaetales bacterium]|nr:ROK family transcriptional regulator [Spirochaetales bacterium]